MLIEIDRDVLIKKAPMCRHIANNSIYVSVENEFVHCIDNVCIFKVVPHWLSSHLGVLLWVIAAARLSCVCV